MPSHKFSSMRIYSLIKEYWLPFNNPKEINNEEKRKFYCNKNMIH
jgi:hypothetical protein